MLDVMARSRSRDADAVRITTARTRRGEERDGRVRGYLISMTVRVACFGAAVAVGPGVLRWVLMAGAVFLPYIAVVMANAADLRSEDQPLRHVITDPELSGPGDRAPLTGPGAQDPESETPE